jgi:large subunit ribosomal protein L3
VVSQIKTAEKDGYDAVQLGYGTTKKADKPTTGHTKKAGLTSVPRFFKETRADKMEGIEAGSAVNVEEVLSAGDIVDVTGTTKGKGYAGVVKRHHFKGGPKTHGQSDRHRAPGSIGQSTTPGRVYKGKRMAGRMGAVQATVKNLEVVEYADGILLVKGLIPGPISSIVTITRRGTNKKHMGLYKEPVVEEEIAETKVEEIGDTVEEQEAQRKEVEEEVKAEEAAQQAVEQGLAEEDKTESVEEVTAEAVEPEKEEEVVEEKK